MELTNIKDLYRKKEEYLDQEVSIGGWVRSIRGSKNFGFMVVNDGTFFEQAECRCGCDCDRKIGCHTAGKAAF